VADCSTARTRALTIAAGPRNRRLVTAQRGRSTDPGRSIWGQPSVDSPPRHRAEYGLYWMRSLMDCARVRAVGSGWFSPRAATLMSTADLSR
jgi:hypothetical protein